MRVLAEFAVAEEPLLYRHTGSGVIIQSSACGLVTRASIRTGNHTVCHLLLLLSLTLQRALLLLLDEDGCKERLMVWLFQLGRVHSLAWSGRIERRCGLCFAGTVTYCLSPLLGVEW